MLLGGIALGSMGSNSAGGADGCSSGANGSMIQSSVQLEVKLLKL